MARESVCPFKAIADPTRREIIEMLMNAKKPVPMNAITVHFGTSRQAVTKHIKMLSSAGLVKIKKQGREKFCFVNPEPLRIVSDWLESNRNSRRQNDDFDLYSLRDKPNA